MSGTVHRHVKEHELRDVRGALRLSPRQYIKARNLRDVTQIPQGRVGKALKVLEEEGELAKYHESNRTTIYVRK